MRCYAARLAGLTIALTCAAIWLPRVSADDPAHTSWSQTFDFEGEEPLAGWYTISHEGVVAMASDPASPRNGAGALELSYLPDTSSLALIGVAGLTMEARPRSLSFSLKTTAPSPMMFGVSEADGSTYEAYCYSAGGRWYDVSIDLDELMLATGASDENGRLDAREISGIMFADLSNLSGEVGKSLGIKEGPQTLWLDDVRLSTDLAPHRSSRSPEGLTIIYDFEREPPPCLPLGGPELSLADGPDEADPGALRVVYSSEGYRWVGFVVGVGHMDLSGATDIRLSLRAGNQAKLTLVLEERDGSKYSTRLRLDPARGWYTARLPFDRFKLDSATEDENSALDLDQLRVIIPVVDAHRAQVDEDGRGSYSLSRIWCGS